MEVIGKTSKKGMEAHFELFELTEDKEKLRWFVSRMTNPVKLVWAKMADKNYYPCTVEHFDLVFGERKRYGLFDFAKLRQYYHEPVNEYLERIETGATKCGVQEAEKLEYAYKGVSERIKSHLRREERLSWALFTKAVREIEDLLIQQENWVVQSKFQRQKSIVRSGVGSGPKESQKCFTCGNAGHLSKECTNKVEKVAFTRKVKTGTLQEGFIGSNKVSILIDSGATVSCVKSKFFDEWDQSGVILKGLGSIPSKGRKTFELSMGRRNQEICCEVVDEIPYDVLLGEDNFQNFGIQLVIDGDRIMQIDAVFNTDYPELRDWINKSIQTLYRNDPQKPAKVKAAEISLKQEFAESGKTIKCKPYRMERFKQEKLQEIINDLIIKGIIEEEDSAVLSPGFLVPKSGKGGYRLVVDFRKLNFQTQDDYNYLCDIEDVIEQVNGSHYLTTLDLEDGFFQVELSEESKKLCGLAFPFGRYRLKRLGQGMKQSMGIFHHAVKDTVAQKSNVFNYVDDILIVSQNEEQFKRDFSDILESLTKFNWRVNWKKANIACKKVNFMGIELHGNFKKVGTTRIESLGKYYGRMPKTKKEMRSLIGKFSFVRSFIPNFASESLLLEKACAERKEELFNSVIKRWIENLEMSRLHYANYDEYEVKVDASKTSISGILYGSGKIIQCFSKRLSKEKVNWPIFDKELFSIYSAFEKFKYLINGRKVVVITDSKSAFQFLQSGGDLSRHSIRPRQWLYDLMAYGLQVKWVPRESNAAADALTKMETEFNNWIQLKDCTKKVLMVQTRSKKSKRDESVMHDSEISESESENDSMNKRKQPQVILKENDAGKPEELKCSRKLYKEISSIEVPEVEKQKLLLKRAHMGHKGVTSMELLLFPFSWDGKRAQIRDFVTNCNDCKRKMRPRPVKLKSFHSKIVGETLYVDLAENVFTEDGISFSVLVIVDCLSSFCLLEPLRNKTSKEVSLQMYSAFGTLGCPKTVLSDHGTCFMGEFDVMCQNLGIEHLLTSIAKPFANRAERKVQDFKRVLRSLNLDEKDKRGHLKKIQFYINESPHLRHGFSAIEKMLGIRFGPLLTNERILMSIGEKNDLEKTIKKHKDVTNKRINKWRVDRNFLPGDEVFVYDFDSLNISEGIIIHKLRSNNYEVEMNGVKRERHANDLVLKSQNDFLGDDYCMTDVNAAE